MTKRCGDLRVQIPQSGENKNAKFPIDNRLEIFIVRFLFFLLDNFNLFPYNKGAFVIWACSLMVELPPCTRGTGVRFPSGPLPLDFMGMFYL